MEKTTNVVEQATDVDDEDLGAPNLFEEGGWRYNAANQLVDLLNKPVLEELCGKPLVSSLRSIRRIQTNVDKPSTKWELAEALLIAKDRDLFSDQTIRREIAAGHEKKGNFVYCPKRWHPGRRSAREFVDDAGFPDELAGEVGKAKPEAMVIAKPPIEQHELQDFQQDVSSQMRSVLEKSLSGRAIVTLPTGAGKTRVAVHTLHEWATSRLEADPTRAMTLVWLAHTEELCEQAFQCFKETWESKRGGNTTAILGRFWGSHSKELLKELGKFKGETAECRILVSTPQTFINKAMSFERQASLLCRLKAVVIDEAHRAAAPSYKKIIEEFSNLPVAFIGLTATPYSGSTNENLRERRTDALLGLFFKNLISCDSVLGGSPLQVLQDRRILAQPVVKTLESNVRVRQRRKPVERPDSTEIEKLDKEAATAVEKKAPRMSLILNEIRRIHARHDEPKILYFGPSVLDAELMAFLARRQGIRSAALSSETSETSRRRLVEEFRMGGLSLLCNCEVLTTGFDAPKTTHVIVGRPTFSRVLYEQMVGRGLRGPKFGGTERCEIVDVRDRYDDDRPELGFEAFRKRWTPSKLSECSLVFDLKLRADPAGQLHQQKHFVEVDKVGGGQIQMSFAGIGRSSISIIRKDESNHVVNLTKGEWSVTPHTPRRTIKLPTLPAGCIEVQASFTVPGDKATFKMNWSN